MQRKWWWRLPVAWEGVDGRGGGRENLMAVRKAVLTGRLPSFFIWKVLVHWYVVKLWKLLHSNPTFSLVNFLCFMASFFYILGPNWDTSSFCFGLRTLNESCSFIWDIIWRHWLCVRGHSTWHKFLFRNRTLESILKCCLGWQAERAGGTPGKLIQFTWHIS